MQKTGGVYRVLYNTVKAGTDKWALPRTYYVEIEKLPGPSAHCFMALIWVTF